MATHSSVLAWEIPWTEEPGGLQSTGYKESDRTERPNNNHFCPDSPEHPFHLLHLANLDSSLPTQLPCHLLWVSLLCPNPTPRAGEAIYPPTGLYTDLPCSTYHMPVASSLVQQLCPSSMPLVPLPRPHHIRHSIKVTWTWSMPSPIQPHKRLPFFFFFYSIICSCFEVLYHTNTFAVSYHANTLWVI